MWAVGAVFAEMLGLGALFAGENDIDQLAKVRADGRLGNGDTSACPWNRWPSTQTQTQAFTV